MGKIKNCFRWLLHNKIMILVFLLAGAAVFLVPYGIKTASAKINKRELPIYCVNTEKKRVALSFDAAWGNDDTEEILNILKKHDVRVTFFMTGGWIETYPEDVKKILAAGHDLGNHSENHKHMEQLSSSDCERELMLPHEKVEKLTGYNMCLFRPPYGGYNDTVINTAEKCGYYTIQWSVDSLDWKDYGTDSIVRTILHHKNLKNGAIILMHNGAKYTKSALDAVITGLKEMGYEIVPISELIYTSNYEIDHTGMQNKK